MIIQLVVVATLLFKLSIKFQNDGLFRLDILLQKQIGIHLLASSLLDQKAVMLQIVHLVSLLTQLILDRAFFTLKVIDFVV